MPCGSAEGAHAHRAPRFDPGRTSTKPIAQRIEVLPRTHTIIRDFSTVLGLASGIALNMASGRA